MSRRPEPAGLLEARRAAIRWRLIDGHDLLPSQADRWIRAWVNKGGEPPSPDDFAACYEWIVGEITGGARR